MSKRFLKQIGFAVLLIFVSNFTSQPGEAMRRANWGDYEVQPRIQTSVRNTPYGEEEINKHKERLIAEPAKERENKIVSVAPQVGYSWQSNPESFEWYVCRQYPETHTIWLSRNSPSSSIQYFLHQHCVDCDSTVSKFQVKMLDDIFERV